MKIHHYRAFNFGPFQQVALPIGGMRGIWFVNATNHDRLGNNGVGKSSLYDPLFYGLTGQSVESMGKGKDANKTLQDLVFEHDDHKKAGMIVEVRVDDKRIVRGHGPKKFKVFKVNGSNTCVDETAPISIDELEGEENLTATISQETLEKEWNINLQALSLIFRFGGGESGLQGYMSGSTEFHRKIQDALVHADRLTRCLEMSRKMINVSSKKRVGLDRDVVAAQEKVDALKAEIEKLQRQCDFEQMNIDNAIVEAERNFNAHSGTDLDAEEKLRKAYDAVDQERRNLQVKIDGNKASVADVKTEVANLKQTIETTRRNIAQIAEDLSGVLMDELLAKSRKAYEAYEQKQNDFARFQAALSQYDELKRKVADGKTKLVAEQGRLAQPQKDLDKPLPKEAESNTIHEKRLAALKVELENERAYRDNLQEKIIRAGNPSEILQNLQATIVTINGNIRQRKEEIAEIDREIEGIRKMEPGSSCPTCMSAITLDHVEHAVEVIEKRKLRPQQSIHAFEMEIGETEQKIAEVEEQITILANLKKEFGERKDKVKKLEDEQSRIVDTVEVNNGIRLAYESAVMARQQVQQTVDGIRNTIKMIEENIAANEAEMQRLQLPDERLKQDIEEAKVAAQQAAGKVDAARENKARLENELKNQQANETSYAAQLVEKQGRQRALTQETLTLLDAWDVSEKKLAECHAPDGEAPMTLEAIQQARFKIQSLQKTLDDLRAKKNPYIALLEEKREALKQAETSYAAVRKNFTDVDGEMPYLKFWESAFGPEGIRPMAMREMLPVLNKQVMRWMSKLPGHQVGLKFDDQLDLSFFHWEKQTEVRYARLSSGMKMRVNVATALAFRDTICAATGCDLPVFVSDEGLEGLDENGIEGYFNCLEEIGRDSCVILINHHPHARKLAEERGAGQIIVERRNEISTMRIG